ncbi:MAG: aminotransferase class III-fold pyridoxal phosphate-dependent enzyme [Amylibacter sp.]|nr:aminotransferase class III-fold pyridoxal phosphate-dependent enzyme [Amylibacter sp.]
MQTGKLTYSHAKSLIPGGTQLLSKRPELFSSEWPAYYKSAKGVNITGLDGEIFTDMSIMGVGAAVLGYADDDVDEAVIRTIKNGVQTSLMSPIEVELAETLLELHPWFDGVRYAKSGGEALAIAVRIARAATGREKVFFSGYHGWHDWYLAANLADCSALDGELMPGLSPNGVPRSLQGTSYPIDLNDIEASIKNVNVCPNEIACIIIEPARGNAVGKEVLNQMRKYCDMHNIVLIFDEITSGFRSCVGAMHRLGEIKPDMSVLAKGMANGYPLAAILGIEAIMDGAQNTFISSTNWTEATGLAAALATICKYQEIEAAKKINLMGSAMKNIWKNAFETYDLDCSVSGIDSLPAFKFNDPDELKFYNFFVSEMLNKGVLAFRQFKPSTAHSSEDLELYSRCLDETLEKYNNLNRDVKSYAPVQTGFHRLTKE